MMLPSHVYDTLNRIQRWLPALGVCYLAISKIWGIAYGSEVNDTIDAVSTLLAATLEASSADYYKNGVHLE